MQHTALTRTYRLPSEFFFLNMLFCRLLISFKNIYLEHQSVKKFGSRSDPTSDLIRIKTVSKCYQQTTLVGIEFNLLIFGYSKQVHEFDKQCEDQEQMPHYNQDLHCLLRLKQSSGTSIHDFIVS